MLIYKRGDRIPPALREQDDRFLHNGQPSATALRRYWRLQDDGSPDPSCKSYRAIWEIDLHHRAYPELGVWRVDSAPVGRPKTKGKGDRAEYQREYYLARKEKAEFELRESAAAPD